MSGFGGRGQSSRSLINDFQLQSYGGEAVPFNSHADSHASEVEFSEIDLDTDPSPLQQTKVLTSAVSEETSAACTVVFVCPEQLKGHTWHGPGPNRVRCLSRSSFQSAVLRQSLPRFPCGLLWTQSLPQAFLAKETPAGQSLYGQKAPYLRRYSVHAVESTRLPYLCQAFNLMLLAHQYLMILSK